MTGTGVASLIIEVLVLSRLGSHYIWMFSITGFGSITSLMLLIFAFDDKRFEPNWVLIFTKSATKKYYTCKAKNLRKKSIEATYHNLVTHARIAHRSSLEGVKLQSLLLNRRS